MKVAVIDSGIDYTHPDLDANFAGGYDFVNNDADPIDDNGHGTHVSGTIGAVGNNSVGVVGVSSDVRIMALKFLGSSGAGSTSDAVEALEYVIAQRQAGVNVRSPAPLSSRLRPPAMRPVSACGLKKFCAM